MYAILERKNRDTYSGVFCGTLSNAGIVSFCCAFFYGSIYTEHVGSIQFLKGYKIPPFGLFYSIFRV